MDTGNRVNEHYHHDEGHKTTELKKGHFPSANKSLYFYLLMSWVHHVLTTTPALIPHTN